MVEEDNKCVVVERYCTGQPDENADVYNEEHRARQ